MVTRHTPHSAEPAYCALQCCLMLSACARSHARRFAESSEALHDVRASTALPTPTTSRAPPPMLLRQLTPQVVRDLDHVGSKGDERQCMDVFSHFVGHVSARLAAQLVLCAVE